MNDIGFPSGSNFNEISHHPRIKSRKKTRFKDSKAISDWNVYQHLNYIKSLEFRNSFGHSGRPFRVHFKFHKIKRKENISATNRQ